MREADLVAITAASASSCKLERLICGCSNGNSYIHKLYARWPSDIALYFCSRKPPPSDDIEGGKLMLMSELAAHFDGAFQVVLEASVQAASVAKPNGGFGSELGAFKVHLVAHLIVADGKLTRGEIDFARAAFGFQESNASDMSFWKAMAGRNPRLLHQIPEFVQAAVLFDKRMKARGTPTGLAAAMVGCIGSMCTYVLASDDEVTQQEADTANRYVTGLSGFLRQQNVPVLPDGVKDYTLRPTETATVNLAQNATETVQTPPTQPQTPQGPQPTRDAEHALQDLKSLIGLSAIKTDVASLINYIRVRKMRQEHGLQVPAISLHMVFTGNPGTGKTTVARLLAEIYRSLNLLTKGHLVETDRSGLVGGYVGQTALKVQEVVQRALGGVLFIDEAYSLVAGAHSSDYGSEAVDTLLKLMEDNRNNLAVIVAGYDEKMADFLVSNPGLKSRFNKFMHFPDYTPEELYAIFERLVTQSDYALSPGAARLSQSLLTAQYELRDHNFGNGRLVRNFFERTLAKQSDRIATKGAISSEDLRTLVEEDLPAGETFH
jgi:stage V sporulation protein K